MLALATRVNEVGYLIGTIYSLWYLYSHWGVLGGAGLLVMLLWNPLAFLWQILGLLVQLFGFLKKDWLWEISQEVGVRIGRVCSTWAGPTVVLRTLCGIAAAVTGPLLVWQDCHLVTLWSSEEAALYVTMPASFTLFLAVFEVLAAYAIRRIWLPTEYLALVGTLNSGAFLVFHPGYKGSDKYHALFAELCAEDSECDEEIGLYQESEKLIRLK